MAEEDNAGQIQENNEIPLGIQDTQNQVSATRTENLRDFVSEIPNRLARKIDYVFRHGMHLFWKNNIVSLKTYKIGLIPEYLPRLLLFGVAYSAFYNNWRQLFFFAVGAGVTHYMRHYQSQEERRKHDQNRTIRLQAYLSQRPEKIPKIRNLRRAKELLLDDPDMFHIWVTSKLDYFEREQQNHNPNDWKYFAETERPDSNGRHKVLLQFELLGGSTSMVIQAAYRVENEEAVAIVIVTLEEKTGNWLTGFTIERGTAIVEEKEYPLVQIISVQKILEGEQPHLPPLRSLRPTTIPLGAQA